MIIPIENEELYHIALKRLVELGYHDTGRNYNKDYTGLAIYGNINNSINVTIMDTRGLKK